MKYNFILKHGLWFPRYYQEVPTFSAALYHLVKGQPTEQQFAHYQKKAITIVTYRHIAFVSIIGK